MATLIAETEWSSDLDPNTKYMSAVDNGPITNVYTGKSEPLYNYYNTTTALSSLAPAANILVAGPDLIVSGDVGGLWTTGAGLTVAITVTGGTNISTTIANGTGNTFGPEQWAAQVASALNTIGAGDIQCGASTNKVSISALAGVTALTITTWAVA